MDLGFPILHLFLFVLCLPAVFDFLISPGQKGLITSLPESKPTFSNWPRSGSFSYTQRNRSKISKAGQKNLSIEKETLSTKNDVVLTYKSQNAKLSGSDFAL